MTIDPQHSRTRSPINPDPAGGGPAGAGGAAGSGDSGGAGTGYDDVAHTDYIHHDSFDPDSPYIDVAVEVFSMLADMTRVKIILALHQGELPVGEIASRVGKTPTSVSQHLAKLRMARMVSTRQEGTRVFYSLQDEHASNLVVQAIYQAEHAVDGDWPPHQRRR